MTMANDERAAEVERIRDAYADVEANLRNVVFRLRTTDSLYYQWVANHQTAVSGLIVAVQMLRNDVPDYDGEPK